MRTRRASNLAFGQAGVHESSKRDPTPWEAQCILLALKAMTTDDWALAKEKIEKDAGPPDATSS